MGIIYRIVAYIFHDTYNITLDQQTDISPENLIVECKSFTSSFSVTKTTLPFISSPGKKDLPGFGSQIIFISFTSLLKTPIFCLVFNGTMTEMRRFQKFCCFMVLLYPRYFLKLLQLFT